MWRSLEGREHGYVTFVCEMKIWKRDACSWDENMDVWERICVALVCELRMWMCVCLWDENIDVWELTCVTLVCELRMWICVCLWDGNIDVWELTCVTLVCELRIWVCGRSWDENMDVWRLYVSWECRFVTFVDENVDAFLIGRGWQCSLCKCVSILKLETALWYLHTRRYGVPFWLWRDLHSAGSTLTVHSYSC
jgi:hypothetical protein